MKNAILFGNGMNLVGGNSFSWEDLLKSLSPRGEMPSSSNTLSYECIYLSRCSEDSCEAKEGLVNELTIKKQIAAKCQQFESNDIYELMMSMPTDVFLTTNYDDVLGKTFEANEYVRDRQHDGVSRRSVLLRFHNRHHPCQQLCRGNRAAAEFALCAGAYTAAPEFQYPAHHAVLPGPHRCTKRREHLNRNS